MPKTLEEIEKILDSPLDPFSVEWKPFDTKSNGDFIQYAPYIDARAVRRLLDAAFTRWGWSASYEAIDGGFLCTITATVGEGKSQVIITKTDGAGREAIEPIKSGVSNSLKRAAVGFGIGSSLYEFPRISIKKTNYKGERSEKGYEIMKWALPLLDELVGAWAAGWRPEGDQVFLSVDRKPAWAGQAKKAAPVRVEAPDEPVTENKPAQVTESRPGPAETSNKPAREEPFLKKAQLADSDKAFNEFRGTILRMFTPDQFNEGYQLLMEDGIMQRPQKGQLYKDMEKEALRFGIEWDKTEKEFQRIVHTLTAEDQEMLLAWIENIDALTAENSVAAQHLYDEAVQQPEYFFQEIFQRLVRKAIELDMAVEQDPNGAVVILPF